MADGRRLKPAWYNLALAHLTVPVIRNAKPIAKEVEVFEGMVNYIDCEVWSIPHARIWWRLDGENVTRFAKQVPHEYDPDMAESQLAYTFVRAQHYKTLECLATNEAVETAKIQGSIGEWQKEAETTFG